MFFFSREKPKIKQTTTKKDSFSGWLKCSECEELIHGEELKANLSCCPKCGFHYRMRVKERIEFLIDADSFEELFANITPCDPLGFVDSQSYSARLTQAQNKTGLQDALVIGRGTMNGHVCVLAAMEFEFMGGSMGSVVGEKLTRGIEYCIEQRLPLVAIITSGGARMQESTLSLMQMAKTSCALARLSTQRLPFFSVLTNPTTGGVTASFASLGDLILAEPKALICFAGPRVIEQTMRRELPPEAQKSEHLLEHGMIDCIVKRHDLKHKLSFFLDFFHVPVSSL